MKIKYFILPFVLFGLQAMAGDVFAQTALAKCDPSKFKEFHGLCLPIIGLPDRSIEEVLTAFLQWLIYVFGFISVMAFVVNGLQYLLSGGNEKIMERAKRNFSWSVVGIIVALSSLVILNAINELLRGNVRA